MTVVFQSLPASFPCALPSGVKAPEPIPRGGPPGGPCHDWSLWGPREALLAFVRSLGLVPRYRPLGPEGNRRHYYELGKSGGLLGPPLALDYPSDGWQGQDWHLILSGIPLAIS